MASRATRATTPAAAPASAARTASSRDPRRKSRPSTSAWNAGAMESAASRADSCPAGRAATRALTARPARRSTASTAEVISGDDMHRTVGHPSGRCPASLGRVNARRTTALVLSSLALAGSVLAASGCGGSVSAVTPQVTPAADRPAAVPVSVPRISGTGDLTIGEPTARPTVVNLWASWCGPCKEEMPAVERFAAANPGVRVVGVAIDDAPDAAREFAREVGVSFPLGVDGDDRVGDEYGVTGLPTTLLLDRQGRLASTWAGPVTEADLEGLAAGLADPS